jgi:hypothetical protein
VETVLMNLLFADNDKRHNMEFVLQAVVDTCFPSSKEEGIMTRWLLRAAWGLV